MSSIAGRGRAAVLLGLLAAGTAAAGADPHPSIDDLISLERPSFVALSPDGKTAALTVDHASWEKNAFVSEIWLVDVATGATRKIATEGKTNTAPAWSHDGRWLAFLGGAGAERPQVVRVDPKGGGPVTLTHSATRIDAFAWSPAGDALAYVAAEPPAPEKAAREKTYDAFEIVGEDLPRSHLWLTDAAGTAPRRLTSGLFSVGRMNWSPSGAEIAFDRKRTSFAASDTHESDLSVVTVDGGAMRDLVVRPGPDASPVWSPDGRRIAFYTGSGNPDFHWNLNWTLASVASSGGAVTPLPTGIDELAVPVAWTPSGLLLRAYDGPWAHLYRLDPASGAIVRLPPDGEWAPRQHSLSRDFSTVAFVSGTGRDFVEVYVAKLGEAPRKLTDFGAQVRAWPRTTRELIRWTSADGTEIQGVLHKPAGFDPQRRYPLLIAIHGGPTSTSRPVPYDDWSYGPYPMEPWLAKGALVLQPNYRGSLGRGERFKSMIVGNLSVGEGEDVLAGIDALARQGIVDPGRVGVMGWSYGGVLTAYLSTHDPGRMKAASVGAGIIDWRTDYATTDLPDWVRHFNGGTPWERPEAYAKASPLTYASKAGVPTLIQHGEADPRVPAVNARMLHRALQDHGVESRLVLFRGSGHILPTPRMLRAAMQQNYDWFNHYLWGEPAVPAGTGAW